MVQDGHKNDGPSMLYTWSLSVALIVVAIIDMVCGRHCCVCGRHYIGSNYHLPVGQVNFASELYQHLFSSDTPLISDWFTVHRRLQQIIYLFSVVNFTF